MTFINSYRPPAPTKQLLSTPQDDVNFAFPLPAALETSRVKLIPFIPSKHAQLFFDGMRGHNLFHKIPFQARNLEEFLWFVEWIRADPSSVLLLIVDKIKVDSDDQDLGGSMAGIIGLLHSSRQKLSTEIGPAIVLPPFQHTHVSTNAIGLMMHYCLDRPSTGGLGFRRVQWTANRRA